MKALITALAVGAGGALVLGTVLNQLNLKPDAHTAFGKLFQAVLGGGSALLLKSTRSASGVGVASLGGFAVGMLSDKFA